MVVVSGVHFRHIQHRSPLISPVNRLNEFYFYYGPLYQKDSFTLLTIRVYEHRGVSFNTFDQEDKRECPPPAAQKRRGLQNGSVMVDTFDDCALSSCFEGNAVLRLVARGDW